MRPGKASELKSTGLGPGVMQMAQGAPGDMVPVVEAGLLPMAGRASAGAGTSMVNWRGNFSAGFENRKGRGGPVGAPKIFLATKGQHLGGACRAGRSPRPPPRV